MRNKNGLILASICVSVLAGCHSDSPPDPKAPMTAADDALPANAYPQIVMQDGTEKLLVKEQPVIHPPSGDDTLMVRIPFRSISDDTVNIKWQMVFSTDDGEQLTENPVWHQEVFLARTRKYIEARALSTRATKWTLTIQAN